MAWVDGDALSDPSTSGAWRDTGAQLRLAHDAGGGAPFGAGFGGYEHAHTSWRDFFETFAERELSTCEREYGFPADEADRIRAALAAAVRPLDAPCVGWCHGDFQPEHVLIDPATDCVVSIIDWADHGSGDVGWDIAVLTIDDDRFLDVFLDGYDAGVELRGTLDATIPVLQVVRLVSEAHWLGDHGLPVNENFRRVIGWRA